MVASVGVRAGLTVDHLVTVGGGAHFNELGGPGLFAALGARLVGGVSTHLFTYLPDDEPGFRQLFNRIGVDVRQTVPTEHALRLWILNSPQGRRIVPTAPPNGVELDAPVGGRGPEVGLLPEVPDTLVLDAMLESSPLERPAESRARIIGIDPHQVPLRELGFAYLERVVTPNSIVLPSRVQLNILDTNPIEAAKAIHQRLNVPVVARLDTDGMLVLEGGNAWTVRDDNVRVVETTGAGDASAAAIVAALAAGHNLVAAAEFGISAARLSLSAWGHKGLLVDPLDRPLPGITTEKES